MFPNFTFIIFMVCMLDSLVKAQKEDKQKSLQCNDPSWCEIPIPTKSLFGFTDKIDKLGWQEAQIKAMTGEQVLLPQILKHFPNYLDFLDGDVKFRKYHYMTDLFMDKNRDLSPLTRDYLIESEPIINEKYKWGRAKVLPKGHDFYPSKRAAIVKLGYFAFSTKHNALFFGGPELGKAMVSRKMFLDQWYNMKESIKTHFIAMDVHDENWGFLSTYFPNRTGNWELCCTNEENQRLLEFLNHNMTTALIINQHHNYTHPKLITLPRGLPLHIEHNNKLIWDTMHTILNHNMIKKRLIFTAATNSVHRPRIINCIRKNFQDTEFTYQIPIKRKYIMNITEELSLRRQYYMDLATTRVGLALPGIGYDTYRLWELLTMGAVAVLERGVGLDRTVWRLPVLLVEDYSTVTPALLRAAYIEAIYRTMKGHFEFQRLTQSYWYSLIMHISRTRTPDSILDRYPMHPIEQQNFTRPVHAYHCGSADDTGIMGMQGCGKETKRPPIEIC